MDKTIIIKKKVEKGLVLDEYGNWISLAEKVKSEKLFLKHLEDGEVLYGKNWVSLKDAIATSSEKLKKSDNTLDETHKLSEKSNFLETAISVEAYDETEINEEGEIFNQIEQSYEVVKNQDNKKSDNLFINHCENETVFFKIEELANFKDEDVFLPNKVNINKKDKKVNISEDIEELIQSFDEFNMWEKTAKKRQAVFLIIGSGIATIIGFLSVLLILRM